MNGISRISIRLLAVLVAAGSLSCSHGAADSTQPHPLANSAPFDKVNFLGARTTGQRVVFICDATGSRMEDFDAVRTQLRKTIEAMQPPQCLNVVFLHEDARPPIEPNLLLATPANKYRLIEYMDGETARRGTDPDPALRTAFSMHPDVIYLFCDPSCFPDPNGTIKPCLDLNPQRKVRIMTICFADPGDQVAGAALKQIAADNGGHFSYVSEQDLEWYSTHDEPSP